MMIGARWPRAIFRRPWRSTSTVETALRMSVCYTARVVRHDGGSNQLVRKRSDACGSRSGNRRGKLGGQAVVGGVAGTWKGLSGKRRSMASNLTNQVRNIAEVTTAIAPEGNSGQRASPSTRRAKFWS